MPLQDAAEQRNILENLSAFPAFEDVFVLWVAETGIVGVGSWVSVASFAASAYFHSAPVSAAS